jgi:hypothetical protein
LVFLPCFSAPRGEEVWEQVQQRKCINEVRAWSHISYESGENALNFSKIPAIVTEALSICESKDQRSGEAGAVLVKLYRAVHKIN